MPRYFNKVTKTEVIPGFNVINSDCVELPEDHFFWRPLPTGKTIEYGADGLPLLASIQPTEDQAVYAERAWRNAEITKIVGWLNQVFNDQLFGTASFTLPYTAEQLNAYRVALCEYPAQEGFPYCGRPSIEDYGGH